MAVTETGWALVCVVCRSGFDEATPMGEVAEHWNTHAGAEFNHRVALVGWETITAEIDHPYLELTWLGPGPEPKREFRS